MANYEPVRDDTVTNAAQARANGNNYEPVTIDQLMITTPAQKTVAVLERIEVLLLNIMKLATAVQRPVVKDAFQEERLTPRPQKPTKGVGLNK